MTGVMGIRKKMRYMSQTAVNTDKAWKPFIEVMYARDLKETSRRARYSAARPSRTSSRISPGTSRRRPGARDASPDSERYVDSSHGHRYDRHLSKALSKL